MKNRPRAIFSCPACPSRYAPRAPPKADKLQKASGKYGWGFVKKIEYKYMEFKDLLKFIKKESQRLTDNFGKGKTQNERILARMVKLGEEFGELCDDVLAFNKDQRPSKLKNKKETDLAEEVADVIITALLLADVADVDIEKALERKIKKISKRKY